MLNPIIDIPAARGVIDKASHTLKEVLSKQITSSIDSNIKEYDNKSKKLTLVLLHGTEEMKAILIFLERKLNLMHQY